MLTLKEAREILRVCNKTIQRWDKQGKIKCVRTPGNRRLIPESEILKIMGNITPSMQEKPEIKPEKHVKVEKEKKEPKKTKPEKPETLPTPKELTRYAILDALEPSGLAMRSAFGDLLSAATLLKNFTRNDLMARARCPEPVAKLFCERMISLGYLVNKDGTLELQVEVLR